MFKKILVAVDHSEISNQVFEEATTLAKAIGASLMLLHVLSPLEAGYPTPVYPGPDSMYPSLHEEAIRSYAKQWEIFERQGLELLRSLTEQANTAGIITDFTQNAGDPGRVICEIAHTWHADLVIMGRRGRSGLSEIILGSVSDYVLHHAHCSVLIVQGRNQNEPDRSTESEQVATVV